MYILVYVYVFILCVYVLAQCICMSKFRKLLTRGGKLPFPWVPWRLSRARWVKAKLILCRTRVARWLAAGKVGRLESRNRKVGQPPLISFPLKKWVRFRKVGFFAKKQGFYPLLVWDHVPNRLWPSDQRFDRDFCDPGFGLVRNNLTRWWFETFILWEKILLDSNLILTRFSRCCLLRTLKVRIIVAIK